MTEDTKSGLSSSYDEIEELQNEYLRELNRLTKIFISLSIAILGLTLSIFGPKLNQQVALYWIASSWLFLLTTAPIGFVQIYFFSRRFKSKAEYLHGCMMSDVIVQSDGSDEKLDEFLYQSDKAKKKFDRSYKWCVCLVLAQGMLLLFSFVFFGFFIYVNFIKQAGT